MSTKIQWTNETWNPTIGCEKIASGCKNCYAIKEAWIRMHNPRIGERYKGVVEKSENGTVNWTGKINMVEEMLTKPFKFKKPTMFFVNSMSDIFHPGIPFEFIDRVFGVIAQCPQHTFQILSKRHERMLDYVHNRIVLSNVLLGTSVSRHDEYFSPAVTMQIIKNDGWKTMLSAEPLLSDVFLGTPNFIRNTWNWVICGGESGYHARAMHPDWARSLRDQCAEAGVPFFFKQWGEYVDELHPAASSFTRSKSVFVTLTENKSDYRGVYMHKVGKKAAGALLDGKEHKEFPVLKTQTA